MNTTLEALRITEARLEGNRAAFKFIDWTSCTCGHIYAGATGRRARDYGPVAGATNERYRDTLRDVCRALNLKPVTGAGVDPYAAAISHYTRDEIAQTHPLRVERKHALTVIKQAIAALEAEQERNRLDVLAQTKDIIDNAPVEVTAC